MIFVAIAVGAMTWSLLEYVIHRFAGHTRFARKNPFGVEHARHHARGDHFAPWYVKGAFALGAVAAMAPLAVIVMGAGPGLGFVGGFVAAYLFYEILHWRLHASAGFGRYARWARRHHFHHHFAAPRTNHGVTSPLWDLVFGTWRRPVGPIAVPPKLAMRWLCDPQSGAVHARLAHDYVLRAGARGREATP